MVSTSSTSKLRSKMAGARSSSCSRKLDMVKKEAQEHFLFLQQCLPLPGREKEFEKAMDFLQLRWEEHLHPPTERHHAAMLSNAGSSSSSGMWKLTSKSLFVFGTCGSGKTSTIMRALRMCSDRPIPGDPVGAFSDNREKTTTISGSHGTRSNSALRNGKVFALSSKAECLSLAAKQAGVDVYGCLPCSAQPGAAGRKRTRSFSNDSPNNPSDFSAESSASSSKLGASLHDEVAKESSQDSPRCSSTVDSTRSSTGSLPGAAISDSSSCSPRVSAGRRASGGGPTPFLTSSEEKELTNPADRQASPLHSLCVDLERWKRRYPHLTQRNVGNQRLIAHYVNCADLTAPQLVNNVVSSIHAACPTLDPGSGSLLMSVEKLEMIRAAKNRLQGSSFSPSFEKGPLHVFALDEVEYARSSGTAVLSELAMYAAYQPFRIALIFISNQRYLVHAPQTLLHDLAFSAYTVSQLKGIAEFVAQSSLEEAESIENQEALTSSSTSTITATRSARTSAARNLESTAGKNSGVLHKAKKDTSTLFLPSRVPLKEQIAISSSVLEYIARKALSDYSGDARQVIAMCRRVVFSAVGQLDKKRESAGPSLPPSALMETSSKTRGKPSGNRSNARVGGLKGALPEIVVSSKEAKTPLCSAVSEEQLKAVVDSYTNEKTLKGRRQFKKGEISSSVHPDSEALPLGKETLKEEDGAAAGEVECETAAASITAAAKVEKAEGAAPSHPQKPPATLRTAVKSSPSSVKSSASPSPCTTISHNSPSPPLATHPAPPAAVTLASSVKLLRTCVVEEEAEQYIAAMTEQMAYVLACLVVLCLQQEEECRRRQCAIRGVASASVGSGASTPVIGSSFVVGGSSRRVIPVSTKAFSHSVTMRSLQKLYSTLMSCRHFPSMNTAGISSAVDSLADINIITRPHRRGTDLVFSFNGTWSLETIETALKRRGEELRKEMEACGLNGSENRFSSVLWELKRIAGLI